MVYKTSDIEKFSEKEIVEVTSIVVGCDVYCYDVFGRGRVTKVDRDKDKVWVLLECEDDSTEFEIDSVKRIFENRLPNNEFMVGTNKNITYEDIEKMSENDLRVFATFYPSNVEDYLIGSDDMEINLNDYVGNKIPDLLT